MFNNIFNYDWIRSVDLWFWKHLTYQLSHNHCPALKFMATPVRQKSFSVLIMVRATFEMAFGLEQDVEECLPAWTWTKWKVFWTYTVKRASLLSIDFIVFCSFEAVHFNLTRGQHLLFTLYSIGRSGGGEGKRQGHKLPLFSTSNQVNERVFPTVGSFLYLLTGVCAQIEKYQKLLVFLCDNSKRHHC